MSLRSAGFAGVASFVLILVAAFVAPLWDIPATQEPAADVAAYVGEKSDAIVVSLFLYSVGFGAFLLFAAGLWAHLRRFEEEPRILTTAFLLAAASLATLVLAAFVPEAVNAYRTPGGETAQLLNDLTFGLLALSGVPTVVALGSYAVLVRRTGCLARWTGWLALVGAAAHLVIAATFLFDSGFLSLEGQVIVAVPATLFAWILAASVELLRLRPT
jgi:hypothetical protein